MKQGAHRAAILWNVLAILLFLNPMLPVANSANLQVTNPADSGAGTLRQALLDAAPGDTITFSPSIFPPGTPTAIYVRSSLPTLDKNNVTLDASSAGVILDGSRAPGGTKGLAITADNCVVRGLIVRYFASDGIYVGPSGSNNTIGGDRATGSGPNGQGNLVIWNGASGIAIRGDGNQVRGNLIGIDGSGTWDWGNASNGVSLWDGAGSNIIGGTEPGHRNVISGNDQNGVWIGGSGTDQNQVTGNFIGTRADGLGCVPNGFSGVAIQGGAQQNRIGGTASGAGNLISCGKDYGIYIGDSGTNGNSVLGNLIGLDRHGASILGQGGSGIIIKAGASNNRIGDGSVAGRNVISGNSLQGVLITDANTSGNRVQGNYIGSDVTGLISLQNGLHGVELANGAHDNLVGGNRLLGEGNLLSGNGNHGLVISYGAHHNTVSGNLIGPDATGAVSLGKHPYGGIDISNGAHDNLIGGDTSAEGNVISGNQMDGLALIKYEGTELTADNEIKNNLIGVASNGTSPLPNGGYGILNSLGAARTRILSNTIAHNETYGILIATCTGNTISQNSIHSNGLAGIRVEEPCRTPPTITGVSLGATDVVTGTSVPNARVEFFSDDEDEGRIYEGFATADGAGDFTFGKAGGFTGPNVTATGTDASGNTSEFSVPTHLLWTVLLYFNGDNDLEGVISDTVGQIAAQASPRANVLALVDGYTTTMAYSGTVVYDLTRGAARPVTVAGLDAGEHNMGDGQTLVDFVRWGRTYSPTHHVMLSILDHGGGWAPSSGEPVSGTLGHKFDWLAGKSGLSWDFSDGYDHLESPEIRRAMEDITQGGTEPLDVVFYDVCLMGMVEVAYQIADYAAYFVSSQNLGWAPGGTEPEANRYVRAIQGIGPTATPGEVAALLVQAYSQTIPAQGHPFTVSAIDLVRLDEVKTTVDQLAAAISQTLTGPEQAATLGAVYSETQKIDYDGDLDIDPTHEGFVDLYDLARVASERYAEQDVLDAAQAVMTELDLAIVAEAHRTGAPWMAPERTWSLDNVHGLSIFLPLGEDMLLPITQTVEPTGSIRLRDLYTADQLLFVRDSAWKTLIDAYYSVISLPTTKTTGPVDGLQIPDTSPPATTITVTGTLSIGHAITITWSSSDTQSGVSGATLFYQLPGVGQLWSEGETQSGSSGAFAFDLTKECVHRFAVQAVDKIGNEEPRQGKANTATMVVYPCTLHLPIVIRPLSH